MRKAALSYSSQAGTIVKRHFHKRMCGRLWLCLFTSLNERHDPHSPASPKLLMSTFLCGPSIPQLNKASQHNGQSTTLASACEPGQSIAFIKPMLWCGDTDKRTKTYGMCMGPMSVGRRSYSMNKRLFLRDHSHQDMTNLWGPPSPLHCSLVYFGHIYRKLSSKGCFFLSYCPTKASGIQNMRRREKKYNWAGRGHP